MRRAPALQVLTEPAFRKVDGLLSSPTGEWQLTTGTQTNNLLVQILSPCDLSPGVVSSGESVVDGFYLYRLGDDVNLRVLSGRCLGNKGRLTVAISNMPTGDLTFLDADYFFRVTNTANGRN